MNNSYSSARFIFLLSIVTNIGLVNYSNAQWILQYSDISQSFSSVSFVDSVNGWVVGYAGSILHTTDGGNNWIKQNSGTAYNLYSVSFCDNQNGWATGSGGTILKTTNGGNNWERVFHDTASYIIASKVQCLSPSAVLILRYHWADDIPGYFVLWQTLDSGKTWNDITPHNSPISTFSDFFFISPNQGWACIYYQEGGVYNTTNAGANWHPVSFEYGGLFKVIFDDSLHGWTTDGDSLYNSSDGGQSWNALSQLSIGYPNYIYKNGLIGYVSDEVSFVKRTTDGGATWTETSLSKVELLEGMTFISPLVGWAVGYGGSIWHTSNGGITSVGTPPVDRPTNFELNQNYPNPFNPSTRITFSVPKATQISIVVYNLLGQKMETIFEGIPSAGKHTFDWNPKSLASGVYFYKMTTQGFSTTKKLIFLK